MPKKVTLGTSLVSLTVKPQTLNLRDSEFESQARHVAFVRFKGKTSVRKPTSLVNPGTENPNLYALIAQRIEFLFSKQMVVGSNPTEGAW